MILNLNGIFLVQFILYYNVTYYITIYYIISYYIGFLSSILMFHDEKHNKSIQVEKNAIMFFIRTYMPNE